MKFSVNGKTRFEFVLEPLSIKREALCIFGVTSKWPNRKGQNLLAVKKGIFLFTQVIHNRTSGN